MNVVLGVVQSDAKVVIVSGEDCCTGANDEDHEPIAELVDIRELSLPGLAAASDDLLNGFERVLNELDCAE